MNEIGTVWQAGARYLLSIGDGIPRGGIDRFLLDALWQSTAIALIALAAALTLRRHASRRAWVGWLGIVIAVAIPFLTAGVRAANLGPRSPNSVSIASGVAHAMREPAPYVLPPTELPGESTHPSPIEAAPLEMPVHATAVSAPALPSATLADDGLAVARSASATLTGREATPAPSSWILLATCVWGMATTARLVRLFVSYRSLVRLIRQARRCKDPAVGAAVRCAAEKVGCRRLPEILISSAIDSPAIVAWGRGKLLLPERAPSDGDFYAVACHELAHVCRRDGWSRLAVEIAWALLPWQPLLWRLRTVFRRACEEACDDWAVAAGNDAVDLAAALANWLRPAAPNWALGMSESVSVTRQRILRLLAQQQPPQPKLGRAWLLAGLLLALSGGTALAFWQTPEKVEPEPTVSDAQEPKNVDEPRLDGVLNISTNVIESDAAPADETTLKDGRPDDVKSIRGRAAADVFVGDQLPANLTAEGVRQLLRERKAMAQQLKQQLTERCIEIVELELQSQTNQFSELSLDAVQELIERHQEKLRAIRQFESQLKQLHDRSADMKDNTAEFRELRQQIDSHETTRKKLRSELALEIRQLAAHEAIHGGTPELRQARGDAGVLKNKLQIVERQIADLAASTKTSEAPIPPYRIAPPDTLQVETLQMSRIDSKLQRGDVIQIDLANVPEEIWTMGLFEINARGQVVLGAALGSVEIAGLEIEEATERIVKHLEKSIVDPRAGLTLKSQANVKRLKGELLVGPDGRVNLGVYGTLELAGKTMEEARSSIEEQIAAKGFAATIELSVSGYHSHVFYIVSETADNVGGRTTSVIRSPLTGNETVLDALSQADVKLDDHTVVQLQRSLEGRQKSLPVDWRQISQGKSNATNYRLEAGDSVYISKSREVPPPGRAFDPSGRQVHPESSSPTHK